MVGICLLSNILLDSAHFASSSVRVSLNSFWVPFYYMPSANPCLILLPCALTTAMLSSGFGRCSHGLFVSVQHGAANNSLSCHFVLSLLLLSVGSVHKLYLLVFRIPHKLFPLYSCHLFNTKVSTPASIIILLRFSNTPLVPFMHSSYVVGALWEPPLLSILCFQIQQLTKCVILIVWECWWLVRISDIALLFPWSSHLPLSICFPLA